MLFLTELDWMSHHQFLNQFLIELIIIIKLFKLPGCGTGIALEPTPDLISEPVVEPVPVLDLESGPSSIREPVSSFVSSGFGSSSKI